MTTDVYRAVAGDYYWLRVDGYERELSRSRDAAPGLRRGADVLEVMVEAIEADGTVVETTWTRNKFLLFISLDGSGWSPVQPAAWVGSRIVGPRATGPRPIPLGPRSVAWLEDEVLAWQEAQIAKRDGRRAA